MMANASASQSSPSEVAGQPRPLPPPNRRRDKPQLSCHLCRRRKLKCDRLQPCGECAKRDLSSTCTYATFSGKQPAGGYQTRQPRKSVYQTLRERIDQLEQLLSAQAHSIGQQTQGLAFPIQDIPSSISAASDSGLPSSMNGLVEGDGETSPHQSHPGLMDVEDTRDGASTTWVETDHWAAILDGISEIKASLDETERGFDHNEYSDNTKRSKVSSYTPELLIGNDEAYGIHDILASLPDRQQIDRYLSSFFQSIDVAQMMFHIPTFLEEYESFWEHQETTSLLWLSMLFGIMCMAMLKQDQEEQTHAYTDDIPISTDTESDARWLAYHYRTKMTQCLKLGNYLKPAPYCIEALLIYLLAETWFSKDASTGVWVVLGVLLRLALRLGYHRDPADFSQISIFQGEMRRRLWCVLCSMDAGYASQYGLPRMLQDVDSNTSEPRNLLEEDLRVDMTELPPARPDNVRTATQYYITKGRLIRIRTTLADVQARATSPAAQYEKVMEIDQELAKLFEQIPSGLVPRPMGRSILDEPMIIFQRLHISIIFNKTLCSLHRRYLPLSTEAAGQKYSYSRKTCLNAAVEILNVQKVMDQETASGGRLFSIRSKLNSLITADFLFSAMVLCADLDARHAKCISFTSDLDRSVLEALRTVKDIWLRQSTNSREARQAHRAICLMLGKVEGSEVPDFGAFEDEAIERFSDGDVDLPSVMQQALGHDYDANAPFMLTTFDLNNTSQLY